MMGEDAIIVAIVFGSIVSIVFLGIVGSIIKAWVKKGSGNSLSENREFLDALREFKEKTDRRLSNLEAIVADERPEKVRSGTKNEDNTGEQKAKDRIEIELDRESEKEDSAQSGKLKNMLNQ